MSATRDRLGVHPLYFREHEPAVAGTIAELLRASPSPALRPDREAIARYLAGDPDDRHSCIEGIGLVPTGHTLSWRERGWQLQPPPPLPEPRGTLHDAMVDAVADLLAAPRRTAIALSGGLDSALVLAIARRELGLDPPVITLAVDVPHYGELETTRSTARTLGAAVHEAHVSARDFLAQLPEAVRLAEVPLWNPHPVSKLLLAQAARREGFDAVLTGDAADNVFGGAFGHDYLPLVGRLLRSQGVEPCSPFFDPRVLAHAARLPADPDKPVLRELAARWLPSSIAWAPKARRLAPDFGIARLFDPAILVHQAERLGLPPPRLDDPRARCGHTTLALLWDALSRETRPCAAS
ncbi:asparagine synthase C-terminal domain-containing protein [Paraliomyxa miuraensis]|uniref:asparagine synthase C-terminal domain-containing protein n=1 Tax=Paraliomyxa miuraensis TaxID=376150 RepID=UPI00225075FA|nr:asparagine synthase C-terminal domain-containing protein [Paraliomyxa miuraensis]MCX4245028.1 asparagine synthase C-terminal domain-containing protein [Paraliomyxa miuraensis]